MTETEIGVMQLQAKECQGVTVTVRSQEETRKDAFLQFQREYGPPNALPLDL